MSIEKGWSGILDLIVSLVPIVGASSVGTAMRWGADTLKGRRWSIERIGIEGVSACGFGMMSAGLADWLSASTTVAVGIATVAAWLGPKAVIGFVERRVQALKGPTA